MVANLNFSARHHLQIIVGSGILFVYLVLKRAKISKSFGAEFIDKCFSRIRCSLYCKIWHIITLKSWQEIINGESKKTKKREFLELSFTEVVLDSPKFQKVCLCNYAFRTYICVMYALYSHFYTRGRFFKRRKAKFFPFLGQNQCYWSFYLL